MAKLTFRNAALATAIAFIGSNLAIPALAEAAGPDYFRVVGIKKGSALNVRANPSKDGELVGKIPASSDGVRNLGCQGGPTFEEFNKLSDTERKAARYQRWCKVDYRGTKGWAAGWHLAEGGGATVSPKPELVGTKWILTHLSGAPVPGQAWMSLAPDGRVTGNAGCNGFNGFGKVATGAIAFEPLMSTMMACPEDKLAKQEAQLHSIISGKTNFQIFGNTLKLVQASGNDTAEFIADGR